MVCVTLCDNKPPAITGHHDINRSLRNFFNVIMTTKSFTSKNKNKYILWQFCSLFLHLEWFKSKSHVSVYNIRIYLCVYCCYLASSLLLISIFAQWYIILHSHPMPVSQSMYRRHSSLFEGSPLGGQPFNCLGNECSQTTHLIWEYILWLDISFC